MSDDWRQLEAELEQATATGLPDGRPLSPETAALRKTWAAWSRLLEAAEADVAAPRPIHAARRRSARGVWPAASAVAAAVSVAMALAATAWIGADPSARPAAETLVQKQPAVAPAAEPDELAWDDDLDEQIAAVSQALRQFEYGSSGLESSFDLMYRRLRQMEQGMADGAL